MPSRWLLPVPSADQGRCARRAAGGEEHDRRCGRWGPPCTALLHCLQGCITCSTCLRRCVWACLGTALLSRVLLCMLGDTPASVLPPACSPSPLLQWCRARARLRWPLPITCAPRPSRVWRGAPSWGWRPSQRCGGGGWLTCYLHACWAARPPARPPAFCCPSGLTTACHARCLFPALPLLPLPPTQPCPCHPTSPALAPPHTPTRPAPLPGCPPPLPAGAAGAAQDPG
jgi:hypothetical protein